MWLRKERTERPDPSHAGKGPGPRWERQHTPMCTTFNKGALSSRTRSTVSVPEPGHSEARLCGLEVRLHGRFISLLWSELWPHPWSSQMLKSRAPPSSPVLPAEPTRGPFRPATFMFWGHRDRGLQAARPVLSPGHQMSCTTGPQFPSMLKKGIH